MPLLEAPAIGSMVQGAQVAFSGIFVAAFMIGAPVLIALIIVDAAFGVVSRVVPQMNIFAVGFPAKMIVGLTLIGASLPFVSDFIGGQLQESVAQALRVAEGRVAPWPTTRPRRQHPRRRRTRARRARSRKSADVNGAAVLLAGLLALSALRPEGHGADASSRCSR